MALPKSTRRALFYSLIFLFIIATPFVVAYSFGYSVDFQNQSLIPSGGIFVKTNQTGIQVTLDGKVEKTTTFLGSGALFDSIDPGVHTVRITKEGFRPWEREIMVRPGIVTEDRNIVLIPTTAPVISRTETPRNTSFTYIPAPNGKHVAIFYEKTRLLSIEVTGSSVGLYQKELPNGVFANSISWLNDQYIAIHAPERLNAWILFRLSTDTGTVRELPLKIPEATPNDQILEVIPHPADANTVYVLTKSHDLYSYSFRDAIAKKLISQVVHAAYVDNSFIFVNEKGFFATANLSGGNISVVGRPGFFLNAPFKTTVSRTGNAGLIDGVKGFYYYDRPEQIIVPLIGGVVQSSFDERGQLALLQGETSLSVVFLAPETTAPFRKKFAIERLVLDSKTPIISSAWYGENYILYTTAEGLFGVELGSDTTHIVQKLSDASGYVFVENDLITVIGDSEVVTLAIE